MSWSIYAMGTKAGVEDHVHSLKPGSDVDRVSFEQAKAAIISQVQRVSTNGVQVEAQGHADQWTLMRVSGVHLHGV